MQFDYQNIKAKSIRSRYFWDVRKTRDSYKTRNKFICRCNPVTIDLRRLIHCSKTLYSNQFLLLSVLFRLIWSFPSSIRITLAYKYIPQSTIRNFHFKFFFNSLNELMKTKVFQNCLMIITFTKNSKFWACLSLS